MSVLHVHGKRIVLFPHVLLSVPFKEGHGFADLVGRGRGRGGGCGGGAKGCVCANFMHGLPRGGGMRRVCTSNMYAVGVSL